MDWVEIVMQWTEQKKLFCCCLRNVKKKRPPWPAIFVWVLWSLLLLYECVCSDTLCGLPGYLPCRINRSRCAIRSVHSVIAASPPSQSVRGDSLTLVASPSVNIWRNSAQYSAVCRTLCRQLYATNCVSHPLIYLRLTSGVYANLGKWTDEQVEEDTSCNILGPFSVVITP